jgi:hypothetical protein
MADFCTLCHCDDINIRDLYDRILKPWFKENKDNIEDGAKPHIRVGGVCEGCGLVVLAVDNKYNLWGVTLSGKTLDEKEEKIIGSINNETFELTLIDY